ncbi:hypothetical protein JTE90_007064 [Oedothorax gibbosus]|uniref:Uncharacterized protein n=1 Tax=Oedothorax gibbosus TaxID=931172 RepID=A0AAV6U1H3_9ARAC|nr:hypothetical protein JTE90_007064 [Oedothorax gibbosus]
MLVAHEMGVEVSENYRKVDIKKEIIASKEYDEEVVKFQLDAMVEDRRAPTAASSKGRACVFGLHFCLQRVHQHLEKQQGTNQCPCYCIGSSGWNQHHNSSSRRGAPASPDCAVLSASAEKRKNGLSCSWKKIDLLVVAEELGLSVNSSMKVKELKDMIVKDIDYDEELTQSLLDSTIQQRVESEQRELESSGQQCSTEACSGHYSLSMSKHKLINITGVKHHSEITTVKPNIKAGIFILQGYQNYEYEGGALDGNSGCQPQYTYLQLTRDEARAWAQRNQCLFGKIFHTLGESVGDLLQMSAYLGKKDHRSRWVEEKNFEYLGRCYYFWPHHTCVKDWSCLIKFFDFPVHISQDLRPMTSLMNGTAISLLPTENFVNLGK